MTKLPFPRTPPQEKKVILPQSPSTETEGVTQWVHVTYCSTDLVLRKGWTLKIYRLAEKTKFLLFINYLIPNRKHEDYGKSQHKNSSSAKGIQFSAIYNMAITMYTSQPLFVFRRDVMVGNKTSCFILLPLVRHKDVLYLWFVGFPSFYFFFLSLSLHFFLSFFLFIPFS